MRPEAVGRDIQYTLRGLRRTPGLTLSILLAFALGVGVNAATFSVVDRVFFKSPPGVVNPWEVQRLVQFAPGYGGVAYPSNEFSTTDLATLQAGVAGRAEIEGYERSENRRIDNDRDLRTVGYATSGLFRLAGVQPFRGRFFTPEENEYGNPHNVAVVSFAYWQRSLGGNSAVLGQPIRIDTALFTIVGIAQKDFDGFDLDVVDVWMPFASLPTGSEGPWWDGRLDVMQLLARRRQGADERALASRLNTLFRSNHAEWVAREHSLRLDTAPLLEARGALRLGPQNDRAIALMLPLAGVALLVLVVAITNVASLLLMRTLVRRRELAVRVALGASVRRLVGQALVESLVLSLAGGAVALIAARWSGVLLGTVLLSDVHWARAVVDGRVVAFTVSISLLAGFAAAIAPAGLIVGRDLGLLLRGGEGTRSGSTMRMSLLIMQTALCMTLLVAAGVFLQSLRHATSLDLGFDPDRLITLNLSGMKEGSVRDAIARIAALPSVASVSRADVGLRGGVASAMFLATGDSLGGLSAPVFGYVDERFASTAGLRILRGRFFQREDVKGAMPVAVIDEGTAQTLWPGRDPIGQCFSIATRSDPCRTIVGVVNGIRWDVTAEPGRRYYLPALQSPSASCCRSILVRTKIEAAAPTVGEIRNVVASFETDPVSPAEPRLVSERLEPQLRPWRVAAVLFLAFGTLALVAAAVGIYGLISYDATQRTREIGIRMALGASPRRVVGVVITSGLRGIAVGLVAGAVFASIAGRAVTGLLFNISPADPMVLLVTALTIVVSALFATAVPAFRAMRVDPVVALRHE